ncbi:MAG: hypothetical protein AABY32_06525 [Nanoarchaeota archaeon]
MWYSTFVDTKEATPSGVAPCLILISPKTSNSKEPEVLGGKSLEDLQREISNIFPKGIRSVSKSKKYIVLSGSVLLDKSGKVIGDARSGGPAFKERDELDKKIGMDLLDIQIVSSKGRMERIKIGDKPG